MVQPTQNPSLSGISSPTVPSQRQNAGMASAAEVAAAALSALDLVQPRLAEAVQRIDAETMEQPSLLPGWRRAHLVSHLARNADALVNLLAWARTGNEQQAYASDEDRDADIIEGADRLARVIQEDFDAAYLRFRAATDRMAERAWEASVTTRQGLEISAQLIPWLRVMETVVHLVDLDMGTTWADLHDLPTTVLEPMLDVVLLAYRANPETPTVRLKVPRGDEVREYGIGTGSDPVVVSGSLPELIGWLTHRSDGAGLDGELPELPAWLR